MAPKASWAMETKLPKKGTGLCACHPFSVAGVFLGVTLPLIKGKPIARWGHKATGLRLQAAGLLKEDTEK